MPGLLFDPHTEHLDHHNAPIAENYSSLALADAIAVLALQKSSGFKFLPSNSDDDGAAFRNSIPETEIFACDNFRMYEFKVRRCMRGRSHDWTECPFAHPGEKARRRDPRRVHYSGSPCPDFRKGSCRRGDFCEFAHGVFECWLHPARYRTQACKDGKNCKRRVCFFAHSPEQLRLLPVSVGGSPAHTVSMGDSPIHTSSMADFSSHTVSLEGSPSQTVSVEVSPSQTVSMVGLPSQKVSMMGSPERKVSMVGSLSQNTKMMGSSSACMVTLPSQKTSMLGPPSLVSSVTLHSCSLNGSPLRQALVHSFLTSEGYGGGRYPLSTATASSAEYFSGSDGSAGVPLGPSNPYLQSCPLGKGNDEVEEAAQLGSSKINLQLGFLGKSKDELSSHSYGYGFGFPSPTSTLAGHYYFPPPLSPPLSPLSSPNSVQTNGTFTLSAHGLHNLHVDATISNREMNDRIFIHNTDHKEDLGFTTQDLQSPHLFYQAQPSLQKLPFKHGKVDSTRFQLQQGSPSLPHVSHSLPCTTRQSRWSPLCNLWDSNGSGLNILPHEVETAHDLQVKIYSRIGEESPMDNLMPDVGWVSELVK